jgi:hypothetical protein
MASKAVYVYKPFQNRSTKPAQNKILQGEDWVASFGLLDPFTVIIWTVILTVTRGGEQSQQRPAATRWPFSLSNMPLWFSLRAVTCHVRDISKGADPWLGPSSQLLMSLI